MKKNLRKIVCVSLVLCLPCLLAGCGENGQVGQEQPQPAKVMYYFHGIITVDGQPLFTAENNKEYQILTGSDGQQYYILETENTYDPEVRNEYDEPAQTACIYRVYDLQGELQKELNLSLDGGQYGTVQCILPADGDLSKLRIMVNEMKQNGSFRVMDIDGNVLVEEQALAADEMKKWSDSYAWLDVVDGFMQVRCSFYTYEPEYEWLESAYFYDLSGQPLEMAQDYTYLYNIYDNFIGNDNSGYYVAYYENAQGQSLTDILDQNCQVVISGLSEFNGYTNGVFAVQRGFERGLMDTQGNWIYQESVFQEIDD